MPKRSKEDTEITISKIMDAVIEQLLTMGYDQMSYSTLSQSTGVSRTGISHHFPKKIDFVLKLEGRLFEQLLAHLNISSQLSDFSKSWVDSLESAEFLAILRLMLHHITIFDGAHQFTQQGLNRLSALSVEMYGEQGKKELERLLGLSIIRLSSS
ncbi:TetR family transcriptional regulator [Vibrio ezurae]|uniref:Putative TetR family transcriptional regulator n=1 Tax=Vibrio ezurae NBRC 102218 TaxID=1219080 RepID=U3B2Z0_9VIBR|nr:TetR family transcriptional regulator [Vibrio ezurae]GAD79812.1 putative TetR family transcriptional regulator [Vibrio ezurae NBRC 102218]